MRVTTYSNLDRAAAALDLPAAYRAQVTSTRRLPRAKNYVIVLSDAAFNTGFDSAGQRRMAVSALAAHATHDASGDQLAHEDPREDRHGAD